MTLSLSRRADRFPDRTAVVDISEERLYAPAETVHENRVSYAGLSTLADWTASRLSALGIEAGDTVCLVSRNRVVSLALLFACRRLGATLAPISHLLTPVTVEHPFDVIDPELVVAEPAQRDLVRSIPFDRSVTLETVADVEPDENWKGQTTDAAHPLLLLHGDGGRPVAAFSERTLEWNCITAAVTWGLSQDDVVPLTTQLSAPDGLVRVALPLLYAGGRLLLDRAFDPGDALTAIADENATLLAGRTAAFRDIAAEPTFDEAIESVDRAIPDATVADAELDPYREQRIAVTRAYGRLECPTALAESVEDAAEQAGESTVGRPVLDCRVRLVDDDGAVLEGSGTGRLQVSGPVVADSRVSAREADDPSRDEWGIGDRTNERGEDSVDDEDERGDTGAVGDANVRTDDDNDDADRNEEPSVSGQFVDGWFDTGDSFHRDDDGVYSRR